MGDHSVCADYVERIRIINLLASASDHFVDLGYNAEGVYLGPGTGLAKNHKDTMKTILSLACLAVVLIVPFALREGWFSKRVEPYPAVLFPIGHGKLNLKDRLIRSSRLELFSKDQEGEEHPLSPQKFFHPIPTVYWPYVASESKQFGLANPEQGTVEKKLGSWKITFHKNRVATAEEKREVAEWLAQQLRASGRPLDRTLVVRETETEIDIATGDEVGSEVTFEYMIRLDDY